ncbi:MAG: transglycosylase domain-containing protein [Bacteroidetes bacterium]|uniref:Transglycosylase domain-containing protein n=1 Tax=Candidatus Cryptobacteroides intestinavium TaxID=2840766 RepID=A0A9D9HI87_9BACT|nr:transglycosylase domain-containing protein [Candidatus Cryptobacteroides intestinavium]
MKDITRKRIVKWFWIIVTVPIAMFILLFLLVWAFADIPSFEELENPDSKLATQVIAEDGEVLTTFHIENRSYVSYEDLSPNLVNAAVATEDVRFYSHSGIDFISLGRVLFKTLLMGDSGQGGGSTITQQLAKTLYPRENVSSRIPGGRQMKMVWIKLKEWITAVKLERNYTKEEIMDMYMNAIFFGSNAYGVQAASKTFFGKNPRDLTVEESAMLVGMVNKPTRYNPVLNPDKALLRRNFVIGQMEKAGYLTKAECDSICRIPITLSYQMLDHNAGIAPYFRDMLRRTMNAREPKRSSYTQYEDYRVDSLQWADNALYGWLEKNRKADGSRYSLDKDGLKIYTTINYRMQKYAEEAVREHLSKDLQPAFWRDMKWKSNKPFAKGVDDATVDMLMKQARRWSDRYRMMKADGATDQEIEKSFNEKTRMRVFAWNSKGYVDTVMTPNDSIRYYKSFLRAGFMVLEPGTGYVKAYVGGPDYRYFKYDNLRQGKRQVGSTIKPFLYTLAMQEGMSPCDKVMNVPQTFIVGDGPEDTWTPKSTDRDEWIGQTVTLKWGLTKSSNNISAYLMKQFGPAAMIEMMRKMGIGSYLPEVPSLCVGSCDLSPYEMIAAYNTFPSRGVYIEPLFVTRIEDSMGNVIGEFSNHKREAISEQTAYLMANLMQGVVNSGTAVRLRVKYGLKGEMAGKTGTTNDQADGWFIGYTPTIMGGAWVGAEDRQIHFESLALGGGSNMALPIWGIFMKKVLADGTLGISEDDRFVAPAGMHLNLDCDGSDNDARRSGQMTEDYFFE